MNLYQVAEEIARRLEDRAPAILIPQEDSGERRTAG
jgi:hypothetical protein